MSLSLNSHFYVLPGTRDKRRRDRWRVVKKQEKPIFRGEIRQEKTKKWQEVRETEQAIERRVDRRKGAKT